MTKLALAALLTLPVLTGGCIFISTTETSAPTLHERVSAGIPFGATLLMYGRGDDISHMPKPEVAPGVVYVYDEDQKRLLVVMPITKPGPVDVVEYIKAKPDHHYRIYYAPSAVAPTTLPATDLKAA
jgi:hypothetical protein